MVKFNIRSSDGEKDFYVRDDGILEELKSSLDTEDDVWGELEGPLTLVQELQSPSLSSLDALFKEDETSTSKEDNSSIKPEGSAEGKNTSEKDNSSIKPEGSLEEFAEEKNISEEDLYKMITNSKNRELLGNLKITDDRGREVLFESESDSNFSLKTNNMLVKISKISNTDQKNNAKIEKFDLDNRKLSEEIINEDGTRIYTEFYKNKDSEKEPIKKNELKTVKEGYQLINYDKNGKPVSPPERKFIPKSKGDFKTVKNDYILGHKTRFTLNDNYEIEKEFRKLEMVINETEIHDFLDSVKVCYDYENELQDELCKEFNYKDYNELRKDLSNTTKLDLKSKVEHFTKIFLLKKVKEILKDKKDQIMKTKVRIEKAKTIYYKININDDRETKTFEIPKAREFDDNDKLKVIVGEDGKLKLECKNNPIMPGKKCYFTIPNKGDIYLFDNEKGEHHSNFPLDTIKNPNFSVVAAGCFIVDEDCKIAKVVNDSGHFKPLSEDCTESFLRVLGKNMMLSLKKDGQDVKDRSIREFISEKKKISNKGYNISVDIIKCGCVADRDQVTIGSKEPAATSLISERRLNLIDENSKKSVMSIGFV